MQGKVLKVFSNDLYGESSDKKVIVFAAFIHKKYMSRYAIFSFKGEENNNKLCFGSIHLKENSLVTFNVKNDIIPFIDEFILQYETGNVNDEYEIIDISSASKIELVSYNEKDYDKLSLLEEMSIPKPNEEEVVVKKKSHPVLTVLGIVLFLGLLFLGYCLINPDIFKIKNLVCTKEGYHNGTKLSYETVRKITFDGKKRVKSIDAVETYKFKSNVSYQKFKEENRHYGYFGYGNEFKYNDDSLTLTIYYQDNSVIDDYEKMMYALEHDDYVCKEVSDEE